MKNTYDNTIQEYNNQILHTNLYDSDPEYKGTVTGRDNSGTMSLEFFKNDHVPSGVRIPNYHNYAKAILQDRNFVGNSLTEDETPPEHTKMVEQKLTFHTYGALNPAEPYTEEGVDYQFKTKDPRGYSPYNTPWDKGLEISKKLAENYDFAPTGDINHDSGTNPPDVLQAKISNMFYAVQSLYKNFTESLANPRPYGLFKRDDNKSPMLRYELGQKVPLPMEDVNRKIIPQVDVKFRSLTKPSHVPGTSAYGVGIRATGLTSLKSQVDELLFRETNPQLQSRITIAPRQPKIIDSLLKNAIAIDEELEGQLKQDTSSTAWIQNKIFNPYYSIPDDNVERKQITLIPNVYATIRPKTVKLNNSQYEQLNEDMYIAKNRNINNKVNYNTGVKQNALHDNYYDDNTILGRNARFPKYI